MNRRDAEPSWVTMKKADLTIDGKHVACLECGAGPTIVFLHAGASSGRQWVKTAALLEPRYRILAPDLWGFGATDAFSGSAELNHDHQARLVAAVIEQLCDAPVHLVGHSYGGATGVRLMLGRPQLLRACVLIEPVLMTLLKRGGDDEKYFNDYELMARSFLDNVAAGRLDAAWSRFLDYRNGTGTWNGLGDAARERFRSGTEPIVAGFRTNLGNPTSIADIKALDLPTLVLRGENTTNPDRRVAEILRDHIPRCRYQIIAGAEHMSPLSHPAFIAEVVERHILGSLV